MLDRILPIITDSEDYITALSFFQAGASLTREEAERLLSVYAKYFEAEDDRDYAKLCLAVDMLSGWTTEDKAQFAPLELGEGTMDALFSTRELAGGVFKMSAGDAAEIAERVRDENISIPARVLLARTALNTMAGVSNFAEIQDRARELAEFLTGVGTKTLDRYAALAKEVRMKCGR